MAQRSTIQKALIYDAVQRMTCHPTAEEIYEEAAKRCPHISRGTVYRNLNQLAQAGEILRVQVPNAPDRYDCTTGGHCHFLCLRCGHVYDYDLESPLQPDPTRNPALQVLSCDVVFSGYCADCQKRRESESA